MGNYKQGSLEKTDKDERNDHPDSRCLFQSFFETIETFWGFLSFAESELSDLNHMKSGRQGETIWAEML